MGFLYEALAPNFLGSNPKITFFHFLQFLFLPTHLSLRVSSIPKNVHNLNNLVCLSALSTSSFLSYIFFFFLNDLILLFPFLSMFPHGLVFSHVRLYLLLCHLVHLKFFLTFLFSVVFTLSEGYLCHLLNFLIFFSFCFLKHLLLLLIYNPFTLLLSLFHASLNLFLFLPHLYNFLISKFFTFLSFFLHIPPIETKL